MTLGHLYAAHTTLSRDPKVKLLICIDDGTPLFLWINTRAAPHGQGQIALTEHDHQALTHDCFLDCGRLTTLLPNEVNRAKDRGCISRALAHRVLTEFMAAPPRTLTPNQAALVSTNLRRLA